MTFSEPAFPFEYEGDGGQRITHQGMLLRDWFAGHALAGLCASYSGCKPETQQMIVRESYVLADAMLIVRTQ